jgi:type III secretion protein J
MKMVTMWKPFESRWALALTLAVALTGCQSEVQHGLNEKEANDIIVAMDKSGIQAEKLKEEGGQTLTWAISVPKGERSRAMGVLVSNHLPPPRPTGIKEIFKGEGMIPTQTEEAMRKLAAQQGEISQSLSSIDGVLTASVNLNIPERGELDDAIKKPIPSASVVITYRPQRGPDKQLLPPPISDVEVKTLVSKAVMDLTEANVAVKLTPANLPGGADATEGFVDVLGLRMSNDSASSFRLMLVGFILSIVGLVTWIGWLYYTRGSSPQPPTRPVRTRTGQTEG